MSEMFNILFNGTSDILPTVSCKIIDLKLFFVEFYVIDQHQVFCVHEKKIHYFPFYTNKNLKYGVYLFSVHFTLNKFLLEIT